MKEAVNANNRAAAAMQRSEDDDIATIEPLLQKSLYQKEFMFQILSLLLIWDALHDLVPFVQFKKCEKRPWKSVTFSKAAGLSVTFLKVTLLYGCFSWFLNCTYGTKSRKTSHIELFYWMFVSAVNSISFSYLLVSTCFSDFKWCSNNSNS